MKLAQINLVRGQFIPGLGSAQKIEDIEAETQAAGIVVTTATAKVLIPWERVESVVTEWIKLPQAALTARAALRAGGMGELIPRPDGQELASLATVAQGAKAHGTGMFAHVERLPPGFHGPGLVDMLAEAQAMSDATDILNMTKKSDAAFEKNSKAIEEFHQKVARELHGAILDGAVQAATIGAKDAVVVAGPLLTEEGREKVRAQLQPPPPSKKGGRGK